ncbi:MAG: hypothetical protein ACR2FY_22475 [Pirellulaceae bacterium]
MLNDRAVSLYRLLAPVAGIVFQVFTICSDSGRQFSSWIAEA